MGNQEIVDRINRRLFTERKTSVFEEGMVIFVICFLGFFLAMCLSGI